MALAALAELADLRGDRAASLALTDEALDLAEQLDATPDVADLLCARAQGSVRAGDLAGARAGYQRAADLARRSGLPEALALARSGLGQIARLSGDLAEARRLCEAALAECPRGWYTAEAARASVLIALGRVAEAEGDIGRARALHQQAFAHGSGWQDLTLAATVAEGLAGVALLDGAAGHAALLLGAGTALRGVSGAADPDVERVAAGVRERIGAAAYESAYARGAAMDRDQGLNLLGQPLPGSGARPSASGA
jgi:tetratricopeptide (TPR) repeat protein